MNENKIEFIHFSTKKNNSRKSRFSNNVSFPISVGIKPFIIFSPFYDCHGKRETIIVLSMNIELHCFRLLKNCSNSPNVRYFKFTRYPTSGGRDPVNRLLSSWKIGQKMTLWNKIYYRYWNKTFIWILTEDELIHFEATSKLSRKSTSKIITNLKRKQV